MEADDVGGLEQGIELEALGAERPGRRLVGRARVDDLGAERVDELGVAAADAAEPDDADGRAAELDAAVGGRVPALPVAGAQVALGVPQVPGSGEGQRQGELGGRLGEDVGGVGDDQPPRPSGRQVDVVEADGEVGDDLELGASGVEKFVVDRDGGIGN